MTQPDALPEISVLLVEDHLAVRKGLELVLRGKGIRVVGGTDDGEAAISLAAKRQPQVVVLDLGLPGIGGLAVARRLAALDPAPQVLVYTGGGRDLEMLIATDDAPVAGVALKAGDPQELVDAIRLLAAGESYIDPRLNLGSSLVAPAKSVLSEREKEILTLLATGASGAQVAKDLFLSPETVRTHVRNAMTRIGASTRAHAIVLALQSGEIVLGSGNDEGSGPTSA